MMRHLEPERFKRKEKVKRSGHIGIASFSMLELGLHNLYAFSISLYGVLMVQLVMER